MKKLRGRLGIFRSNALVFLLLFAPIFLNLLTPNSSITYSLKIFSILFAVVVREQRAETLESTKLNFVLPLLLASLLIATNFLNSVGFQYNILFNLFWFWYFRDQQWFRDVFLETLFLSLKICGLISLVTTLASLLPQDSELDSTNYFVPLNELLGLQYRQQGIFTHPNTYALFSFLLISLTLLVSKRLSMIWTAVGLFGLLTSGSRTFQILSLLILIYHVLSKKSQAAFILSSLRLNSLQIIHFGVIAYFVAQLSSRTATFSPDSFTGRYGIWSKSLAALSDHLFWGLGTDYSSRLVQNGDLPIFANSAHSLYLDGFLSGGIFVGMTTLALFYITYRNMKSAGGVLHIMFLLIFVAGFTETMFSLASFGVMNLLFAYAYSFSKKVSSV